MIDGKDADDAVMLSLVEERFVKRNTIPSPPHTVERQPEVIEKVLDMVKKTIELRVD